MTITLYIDWENREIYKNEKELVEGYLRDYQWGGNLHFREYLDNNYESDTLFYTTEEEKKVILEQYNADTLKDAKDWAINYNMIHTIEI